MNAASCRFTHWPSQILAARPFPHNFMPPSLPKYNDSLVIPHFMHKDTRQKNPNTFALSVVSGRTTRRAGNCAALTLLTAPIVFFVARYAFPHGSFESSAPLEEDFPYRKSSFSLSAARSLIYGFSRRALASSARARRRPI